MQFSKKSMKATVPTTRNKAINTEVKKMYNIFVECLMLKVQVHANAKHHLRFSKGGAKVEVKMCYSRHILCYNCAINVLFVLKVCYSQKIIKKAA